MAGNPNWKKGVSGNPTGAAKRKTKDGRTVAEIARETTDDAIAVLVEICKDKDAPAAARVAAADKLLDRGWGRPTQPVSGDDDSAPIQVVGKVVWGGMSE